MNKKPSTSRFWRVGELAQAAGVSPDTIRHYERKGALPRPSRSRNGYREYPEDVLDRVRLVRQAMKVGFTLDELAAFLKVRDRGGVPCKEVRNLAAKKLTNIELQVQEMAAVRDELRDALRDWDTRLSQTPAGKRAHLLSVLASRNAGKNSQSRFPFGNRNLKRKGKEK